jgi:hypothetical protein
LVSICPFIEINLKQNLAVSCGGMIPSSMCCKVLNSLLRVYVFYLLLLPINSLGQQLRATENKGPVDSIYLVYQDQLKSMLSVRSMTDSEITTILNEYNSNKITSHSNFAEILGTLYPDNRGIAVLVFFHSKDTLYRIWFEPGRVIEEKRYAITKEDLMKVTTDVLSSLNIRNEISDRSPKLRGAEAESSSPNVYDFENSIKEASDLLLPEKWDTSYRHLVVVPCLNIGVFPFYLLPVKSTLKPLVEQCSFSIAPSLLDIIALRTRLLKNVFGYATIDSHLAKRDPFNSFFNSQYEQLSFEMTNPLFVSNPSYPVNGEYVFPDLPGAQREIDSAIQYAERYTLLTGSAANKSKVISALNKSDLAYFATHGMASEKNPLDNSFLVLSDPEPYLTARDIVNLRLQKDFVFPELVILSACQTGLGKSMEAGIVGLARPFLIGGTAQVIMSLWSVNDDATAYLMTRFMHYIQQPSFNFPSEPLRKAVLDTRVKFPNPAYWASFSVFGIDY